MTQADETLIRMVLDEMAQNRKESARAREVIADHAATLRMLPCAGHEIRISQNEEARSKLYGAGAVLVVLAGVAGTVIGALIG